MSKNFEIVRQSITLVSGCLCIFVISLENPLNMMLLALKINIFGFIVAFILSLLLKSHLKTENLRNKYDIRNSFSLNNIKKLFNEDKYNFIFFVIIYLPQVIITSQNVLYPIYFQSISNNSHQLYSFIPILYGTGAICGSVFSKKRNSIHSVLINYLLIMIIVYIGFIFVKPIPYFSYILLFLCAFSNTKIKIYRINYMLSYLEKERFLEVTALFECYTILSSIFLALLFGVIADTLGIKPAWYVAILILLIMLIQIFILAKKGFFIKEY